MCPLSLLPQPLFLQDVSGRPASPNILTSGECFQIAQHGFTEIQRQLPASLYLNTLLVKKEAEQEKGKPLLLGVSHSLLSITKCVLHLLSVFTSTDSFSHWFMMWQAERAPMWKLRCRVSLTYPGPLTPSGWARNQMQGFLTLCCSIGLRYSQPLASGCTPPSSLGFCSRKHGRGTRPGSQAEAKSLSIREDQGRERSLEPWVSPHEPWELETSPGPTLFSGGSGGRDPAPGTPVNSPAPLPALTNRTFFDNRVPVLSNILVTITHGWWDWVIVISVS